LFGKSKEKPTMAEIARINAANKRNGAEAFY